MDKVGEMVDFALFSIGMRFQRGSAPEDPGRVVVKLHQERLDARRGIDVGVVEPAVISVSGIQAPEPRRRVPRHRADSHRAPLGTDVLTPRRPALVDRDRVPADRVLDPDLVVVLRRHRRGAVRCDQRESIVLHVIGKGHRRHRIDERVLDCSFGAWFGARRARESSNRPACGCRKHVPPRTPARNSGPESACWRCTICRLFGPLATRGFSVSAWSPRSTLFERRHLQARCRRRDSNPRHADYDETTATFAICCDCFA